MKTNRSRQRSIQGVGTVRGIAVAPAYIIGGDRANPVPQYAIPAAAIEDECRRLQEALDHGIKQLDKLRDRLKRRFAAPADHHDDHFNGEDIGYLMEAHIRILSHSRLTRGAFHHIREHGLNAEAAVDAALTELSGKYEKIRDDYLRSRLSELRDAGNRILHNLSYGDKTAPERDTIAKAPPGSILIAESFTPAEAALMHPDRVAGFVTALGGIQDHSAIMARSLGIPAVTCATDIVHAARSTHWVIIDGGEGVVILDPDPDVLLHYRRLRHAYVESIQAARHDSHLPAQTRDGTRITLRSNIEMPREVGRVRDFGGEGVGLFRTEFIFMNRTTWPDEDEQVSELRKVVHPLKMSSITVRTLDIGSDKLTAAIAGEIKSSDNPALGLRAIRFGLQRRDLMTTQLRAILRVAGEFPTTPVRILLPMVINVSEVATVRSMLGDCTKALAAEGYDMPATLPPLGAMIEIPAAALNADRLARECDFFSIGTNDLTMYALAVDRGNEQVAAFYDPLHPAMLRLIAMTVAAAQKNNITVDICGEMAGDAKLSAMLIGLGLRVLSMVPAAMPDVRTRIRNIDADAARNLAERLLELGDSTAILHEISLFNQATLDTTAPDDML